MRQYTLVFMEQRIGLQRPTPIDGESGVACFRAGDDDAALEYITLHLLERLKQCARADLSSLRIIEDSSSDTGHRLVDDTHANPRYQDVYVKYDAVTGRAQADWESTRTAFVTY